MAEIDPTSVGRIRNHSQVNGDLDECGFAVSKLWSVARYYSQQCWDEDGEIPDDAEFKPELKSHERHKGLHSQPSQRVLEELAEAFNGWYNSDDDEANPPGYRKRGDDHHAITWKQKGIRHDSKHN